MAVISDLLAKADAQNWPILYTKNLRITYLISKSIILSVLGFIVLSLIFFVVFYSIFLNILVDPLISQIMPGILFQFFVAFLSFIPFAILFSVVSIKGFKFFITTFIAVILFFCIPTATLLLGRITPVTTVYTVLSKAEIYLPINIPSQILEYTKKKGFYREIIVSEKISEADSF
jgi:hypothetical protein